MAQVRDDDFILVCKTGDRVEVSGRSRFFRGHKLRGPDAARPDGIYAEWHWDGRELVVGNDRYGASPLFYCVQHDRVAVSPSILTLLEHGAPPDLDDAALAVFMRLGFYVGDDTPFRHIRAVPPGATFRWHDARLTIDGGYSIPGRIDVARDEALDGFNARFHEAMARRLPTDGAAVVPLSGGRDSRHILFELCALGRPPRCAVTLPRYPPRPHEDERIAPLVARAAGVPHVLLQQDDCRFEAELTKNWETSLCADEHAWYMPLIDALGSATAVYDGLGGALSVPSRFLSTDVLALFAAGRTTELATRLLDSFALFDEAFLGGAVAGAHRAGTSREQAIARLSTELARHAAAPDPVKSFNFWNRIRRELAVVPYALMRDIPVVYSPYLDHGVYDYMMALPPTVLAPNLASADKSFHSDAVHRAFPQFAHIPFENTKAPKIDASAHNARFARAVAAYLFSKRFVKTTALNRDYVYPRLAYGLVRRGYRESHPWLSLLALYLFQLDAAAAGLARSPSLRPRPRRAQLRPPRDAIAMSVRAALAQAS
jgi:asparagine synthase (glutamine-hydrolysing)